MSLQGTFNTAVQAMQAQTQFLNNISTNIANTNTTAYKLQDTHFATLLNHTQPTDKRFFTVNTYDYRQVDKQGSIGTTNRNFDLAINGRGFIVTNTSREAANGDWSYTRDGALFGQTVKVPDADLDGDAKTDREETYMVTASGSYVYGWKADENGEFTETNNLSALTPIVYATAVAYTDDENSLLLNDPALPPTVIPSKATTNISLQANVSASDSGRQTVALPFVDMDGNSRSLAIGFNAQFGGKWTLDMSAVNTANDPVTVTFDTGAGTDRDEIEFDGKGSLLRDTEGKIVAPPDGKIVVEIEGTDGPQTFTIDISKLTQFSDNNRLTVNNIDHDGYIAGSLQKTYFNDSGVLIGSYSNGEVRNLYKLPVALFHAENNLEAKSGNIFARTPEAGDMKLVGIGTSGGSHFVIGALEQSNVDLADQFSKMIVTQRAYSSAAKVLTTADEMTMAARDLKR